MSISQNFPNTRPSLNLNFARSKTLDPRITFSRTSTGTYVDESGFIRDAVADEPRFDHDPVTGECLGLLIEESRSNLLSYSEDFSQWSLPSSITITPNNIVSPDGTQNADLVSTTVNESGPYVSITASQNTTYTLSVFLKYGNTPTIRLRDFDGGDNPGHHVIFNLLTQTFSSALNLDDYGYIPYPNGWYRVWMTFTTGSYTNLSLQVRSASEVSGDETFYAWGGQIEGSSFASSYIPTEGSTKTRAKEYPTISGTDFTDFYNPSEGTIYVKYNIEGSYATDGYNRIFEVSDGGSANRYTALLRGTNQDIYEGGWNATLNFNTSLITFGDFYTYIMGYKENDFQRYAIDRNGNIDSNTDDSVTVSSFTPTELNIGYEAVNDNRQLNGHISQLVYYPARLSNSQLQTLLLQ